MEGFARRAPECKKLVSVWIFQRHRARIGRGLIPAARKIDPLIRGRAPGTVLISRAAATPTLRAYQSALWAAGIKSLQVNRAIWSSNLEARTPRRLVRTPSA